MRETIQKRLIRDGLATNPGQAAALLISGRVYVHGRPARPGMQVHADAPVEVKGMDARYAAKGGYKLEGALEAFGLNVQGRVCLDAGASTGGFTDCLLKHGTSLVYAVDVGYGQLLGSLRQHPRVRNLERTNIGDSALLTLDPRPSLGTADLSYLSLRKAVPLYAAILGGSGDLLCLVKPLFETADQDARRTGNLPDSAYENVLTELAGFINALPQTVVRAVTHSPVTGSGGTLEFFLHVALGSHTPAPDVSGQIAASISAALALPVWRGPEGQ